MPKELRNGDFVAKPFCPFTSYLPLNFILKFKTGKSFLKISNPTSKVLTIKADTALGSVSFDLVHNLSHCRNTITHLHEDIYSSIAMCSLKISECPIHQSMGNDPDIAHSLNCHSLYNHNPQSLDYHTCAESLHLLITNTHTYHNTNKKYDNQFKGHHHEIMMKEYYEHNQDKMTPNQIRELKIKTFPYLSSDDICLSMSDRNIVRKELDLDTDTVLSDNDKHSILDFFYSMRECLSTHDNSSVQNISYVFLKPVNLKPFYIKKYLTYESELKFAKAEMEKLRLMDILHRGPSEFLSPIMLIKKSHSGAKLAKSPEYCLVVDFKYLNYHLPDIKLSYHKIKHVLHKIGRTPVAYSVCLT